ncbi:hypothetical protein GOV13_05270 [Candidatus Pacearchaeota archaeon]|nr:hypothetical protein [Candidatus Pacearchaeota archaeon]
MIVYNVTGLFDQEAIALQNLTTDFNNKNGSVAGKSFHSGLTGVINCTKTEGPADLIITVDSQSCVLTWNNIKNSDQGTDTVTVETFNGTDYAFYSFDVTVYSWKIDLVEGWNLVSIPLVPESTNIAAVLGDIKDNIEYGSTSQYTIFSYQFDGNDDNEWLKARPTSSWTGDLNYVIPGYAYWIKMSALDTLYGFGDKTPNQGQTPPSTTVVDGWNLIGHYGLNTVTNANALTSLALGNTTYYDYVGTDGNFYPQEGYWITAKFLPNGIAPYTPSTTSYNFD